MSDRARSHGMSQSAAGDRNDDLLIRTGRIGKAGVACAGFKRHRERVLRRQILDPRTPIIADDESLTAFELALQSGRERTAMRIGQDQNSRIGIGTDAKIHAHPDRSAGAITSWLLLISASTGRLRVSMAIL